MIIRCCYKRVRLVILLSSYWLNLPVMASDLSQADRFFQQADYESALAAYVDAADVGSAHAFYQLGLMHYKGLGVAQDPIKALVWFDLAAEQQFNDAADIVEQLMALLPNTSKNDVEQVLRAFRQQYGVQAMALKYYPVINHAVLNRKIYFAEEGQTEQSANHFYHYVDTVDFDRLQEEEGESRIPAGMLFTRGRMMPVWARPYSAVADFDVGPDGSARNIEISSDIGYIKTALFNLSLNEGASPQFADKKVSFVNRAYLGVAGYTRAKIHSDSYYPFYVAMMRKAKKLRKSLDYEERFSLALMLMAFPWLPQIDNEAEQLLLSLAQSGFPLAQYEFGAKLYREQTDIPQAIHWFNQASKYGVAKAQYRLARILCDSPWVEKDEKKALFWFSAAAENGHKVAGLKVAELKLLAEDNSLHDVDGANTYLEQAAESQAKNPEYEYLQAMLNHAQTRRNLPEAVKHMREAISMAERVNWDTSEWRALLNSWTANGSVTIVEP